ncbi:GerMN domain-containing protein [Streptomyces fagopyri]|uniref:GerMN domain-containing protein n=1 Tax=Streptomyces fagopyri TaxID=2662397 RepID=UPI0037145AEB
MKGSRVPALLVGLTAALTLAACGVPPSDVIQAGVPASGMSSPRATPPVPAAIPLYFLRDGDPTPYLRKVHDPGDLGAVVRLLFDGPTPSEAVTAATKLPRLTDAPDVTIDDGRTLTIRLPEDVPALSQLAMRQLACTMAHVALPGAVPAADATVAGTPSAPPPTAQRSLEDRSVQVLGDGWTMTQSAGACPDPHG